jgi:hypothetical protein
MYGSGHPCTRLYHHGIYTEYIYGSGQPYTRLYHHACSDQELSRPENQGLSEAVTKLKAVKAKIDEQVRNAFKFLMMEGL